VAPIQVVANGAILKMADVLQRGDMLAGWANVDDENQQPSWIGKCVDEVSD
jgi:hypothetical protein